jgi:uncharacterized protein
MTEPRPKHAVLLYLLIACIPPWIGWSLLTFGVIPQNSPWSGVMFLTGEAASIAGLVMTFSTQGRQGVSRLLREAVRVVVPIRWWLYALLLPPLWLVGAGILYLTIHGLPIIFKPSALRELGTLALLVPFLFGPLGEEFGWRGFLLPRFVKQFSAVPACFFVGVIWAIWHWPLFYKAIVKSPAEEIFFVLANIIGMSFLIGVVYLRTKSLLLSMLMHWCINAMQAVAGKLLPGLPDNALNDTSLMCCGLGVLTVLVALSIPMLLKVDRRPALPDPTALPATPGVD